MSQQQANTWAEPPWSGWIETTGDALLILEAARRGLIPRVTRRLVDSERKMITSGSVFVFDEDESGIKRWTDGFFWSPSRILGNFLLYRETDKKGAGHRPPRSETMDQDQETYTLSRPKGEEEGVDRHRERILVGSLTNSYKFKNEGLMKKTFSLTISGVSQHLISYYKIADVESGRLRSPSSLPELASLDISPEYLDKTHFRNPPKVEIVDGQPRYRGEADELDGIPENINAPIASSLPLLTEGRVSERPAASGSSSKRPKPYDAPQSSGSNSSKRPRKPTNATKPRSPSSASASASPQPLPQQVQTHRNISTPPAVAPTPPAIQLSQVPAAAPQTTSSYSELSAVSQYASYGIPGGFYQYPMSYSQSPSHTAYSAAASPAQASSSSASASASASSSSPVYQQPRQQQPQQQAMPYVYPAYAMQMPTTHVAAPTSSTMSTSSTTSDQSGASQQQETTSTPAQTVPYYGYYPPAAHYAAYGQNGGWATYPTQQQYAGYAAAYQQQYQAQQQQQQATVDNTTDDAGD